MKRKLDSTEGEDTSGATTNSTRRRIDFETEVDSDNEISLNTQANKRRKMGEEIAALKIWMEGKFTENIAASTKQTSQIMESVSINAERSRKNAEDINGLKRSVANIERRIMGGQTTSQQPESFADAVASSSCGIGAGPVPQPVTKATHDSAAFQLSRKRLRLWPIAGEDNAEIMESVVVFCCQALGAPRKDQLGIKTVSRVKSAPRGVAYLEVLVEFVDCYARDDILMRGPMLASYRDTAEKPTAGIRLDIPQHLMGSFKTLEAFGFGLKRRHGKGFRKHIKFDDYTEKLFIQVGMRRGD